MRTLEELKNDESFWDEILYSKQGSRHYDKLDDESKNCNYKLCKKCGGKCCQRCGCNFSPDDFSDLSFDGLLKEIQKGYITLELVDGDQFYIDGIIWLVRMRNVGSPIIEKRLYHRDQSGCIALKENGCPFDYAHRPAGGRLLIPGKKGFEKDCHSPYGTEEALREWKAHQKVLSQIAESVGYANYPCQI